MGVDLSLYLTGDQKNILVENVAFTGGRARKGTEKMPPIRKNWAKLRTREARKPGQNMGPPGLEKLPEWKGKMSFTYVGKVDAIAHMGEGGRNVLTATK